MFAVARVYRILAILGDEKRSDLVKLHGAHRYVAVVLKNELQLEAKGKSRIDRMR